MQGAIEVLRKHYSRRSASGVRRARLESDGFVQLPLLQALRPWTHPIVPEGCICPSEPVIVYAGALDRV